MQKKLPMLLCLIAMVALATTLIACNSATANASSSASSEAASASGSASASQSSESAGDPLSLWTDDAYYKDKASDFEKSVAAKIIDQNENGSESKANSMREDCQKNGYVPVSMANDWLTIYGDAVTYQPAKEELAKAA